jgi:SAM-dependent methyltransferase
VTSGSTVAPAPPTLAARYTPDDLGLFDEQERTRFLDPFGLLVDQARAGDERAWKRLAPHIAWELLYRKEPELYDRLVAGEHIHPDVLARIPSATSAVEIAAGTGRLTRDIAGRCGRLVALEPAAALRRLLAERVRVGIVEIRRGFFDATGISDGSADLVASCSAFTADPAHGGEPGLDEMRRIAAPGALIALVWPADVAWLVERGFTYERTDAAMEIDFGTPDDAVDLARIFYPDAADEIAGLGSARVPYALLGMNPPCDFAWMRT